MDTYVANQYGCATCHFWAGPRLPEGNPPTCVKAKCGAKGLCLGCHKGLKKMADQGSPCCWRKWSELTH